ncbi:MAG: IgGFc-binding protein [Myxococcota bacterium]|nr:IgGFc-binding protein [Myxococcota bacterium]
MIRTTGWTCLVLAALTAGPACSPEDSNPVWRPDDGGTIRDDGGADVPTVTCAPGRVSCAGNTARMCNGAGNGWEWSADCADPTPACTDGIGCTACSGGEGVCDGDVGRLCFADGSGWVEDFCDTGAGERCSGGYCTDLSDACETARAANSYEGCDYWAVPTTNEGLPEPTTFRFAVVVGNRQGVPANVEVFNGGRTVATASVAPNATRTVELPWIDALRAPGGTAIVGNGAYRIRSDVPVTVYQFNPLKYWGGSNPIQPGSYTNDASLLLPRHVLTGNYIVASRSTFMVRIGGILPQFLGGPGFLAVAALEDDTEVEILFQGHTQAGAGIPQYSRGSTGTFRINRFAVLQVLTRVPDSCVPIRQEPHPGDPSVQIGYCDLGFEYDLTGSTIRASKPVAVFSGHDCTFIPYDRWACDHLEEQMFPLEAWGTRYLAARTDPVVDEPNMWRVISGSDGNAISFEPSAHPPDTLDRAQWIEFPSSRDFMVTGTGPLLLVQYLIGQGSTLDSIGDPAMALSVPVDQYRTAYNFLAPEDYRDDPGRGLRGENWVNIIAPAGASVSLDGTPVTAFTPIGSSGFGVARAKINGGSHAVSSSVEFGITCYGYGNYTSYMYPGGLDVDAINPLI